MRASSVCAGVESAGCEAVRRCLGSAGDAGAGDMFVAALICAAGAAGGAAGSCGAVATVDVRGGLA